MNGQATVTGDVTLNGQATVTGDVTLNGQATVTGEGTMNGTGTVNGEGTVKGKGTVTGEGTVEGKASIEGKERDKKGNKHLKTAVNAAIFGGIAGGLRNALSMGKVHAKGRNFDGIVNLNKKKEKTETETKEMTSPTENKSSEDIVKEMLSEVDLEGVDLKDVVGKYNTILAVDKANNTTTPTEKIQKRLTNYVKGLKYHNFEAGAQANNNAEFHSDCAKAKSLDELSKAYQQFGKEYVEFLDQDGDGEINVHEMFYQELQDLYSSKEMKKTEAKKKAIEMLEKFKAYNMETLPDENSELYDTDEMELFTTVMKKIGLLDADKNRQISSDEAGAYLMTTARSLDGKNNIKAAEATQTERGIAAEGFNEEDLKELGYTQEEIKNILSFNNYFKNNFNTYLEFVKSGKMPE